MRQTVWTPIAELELDDLLYYIAVIDRRPETADRIYFEIRDLANHQANSRFAGHRHPEAPGNWRYIRHKRWLIFFQEHPEGIEVMRVIDSVRDLPKQFPNQ